MKKTILVLAIMLLYACGSSSHVMTNDQIIAETKKCKEAGLRAVPFASDSLLMQDDRIVAIQCWPQKKDEP